MLPPGHVITRVGQGPADPRVAPVPVFGGYLHDQLPDLVHDTRMSGAAPAAAIVFLRDTSAMPGEQRVGRDQRLDLSEGSAPACPGLCRQAVALRVRTAEPPRAELLAKDAVLFLEIGDDVALLLVDPAGHGDDEELQRVRKLPHTGRG